MVVLNIKVDSEDKQIYMDGKLHEQLINVVKPDVQKQDFDYVMVIDGEEGSGKSVFAMQIAKILYPDFNLSDVCFTPQQFIKTVTTARKNECIVFDEGFTGLSSRSSLSEINQLLVSLMMEMRQKNLFIIVVMPTVFMLERYVVLHRARGLFHIYMKSGKRGYWGFYNKEKMKRLWIEGKRYFEYSSQRFRMFGRFQNQYTINEAEYRKMKLISLNRKRRITRADAYKEQRDTLLWIMHKDFGKTQNGIADCWKYRIELNLVVTF